MEQHAVGGGLLRAACLSAGLDVRDEVRQDLGHGGGVALERVLDALQQAIAQSTAVLNGMQALRCLRGFPGNSAPKTQDIESTVKRRLSVSPQLALSASVLLSRTQHEARSSFCLSKHRCHIAHTAGRV